MALWRRFWPFPLAEQHSALLRISVVVRGGWLYAPAAVLLTYFCNLNRGRIILWCYLIWYLVVLVRYFDPSPRLWITSLGLSGIIGVALYLSATAGATKVRLDGWTIFRLFLMPFCVSSFAALVKGKNFVLIFSPNPGEILVAVALCILFCAIVFAAKRSAVRRSA